MLRKKDVIMTNSEAMGRMQLLGNQRAADHTDEMAKAIGRTLYELSKVQQEAQKAFKETAKPFAVQRDGEPLTIQQKMQEYQAENEDFVKAVQEAQKNDDVDPPETPEELNFSEVERSCGFVLNNEGAVREAEEEILAEEVEVTIYQCKYSDALRPEDAIGKLNQFGWMIDYEEDRDVQQNGAIHAKA